MPSDNSYPNNSPNEKTDTVMGNTTPIVSDTTTGPTSSTPPSPNNVITAPQASSKNGYKKRGIITIFALALLVLGGISTVILVQRQALVTSQAWDCSKYIFSVSQTGTVTVQNGSSVNEPAQKADVYINNVKVKTVDVPALTKGTGATLGTVTVPGQGFTWKVDATGDCDTSGKYDSNTTAAATCSDVKAYDTNWKLLSADDLKNLKSGTIVRFAVSGTATSGSFDKARFTINGTARPEISTKKPGSEEFYDEYTIPTSVTTFTITAQIHHVTLGWF